MTLEGHFKGIATDVIQNEQSTQVNLKNWLEASEKFNVIITPHIGGATYSSMSRTEDFIASKLAYLIEN
jgi:lactate dehydrogenase-like 2-hydroxyacid dehydrogenase